MYGRKSNSIDIVFEDRARTSRYGVPPELIQALNPTESGKLGMIFLQLAQAMISHSTEEGRFQRNRENMNLMSKARPLMERVDRGIKSIEWDVGRGSTLKQAARSAAMSHHISEHVLLQAVHMRAEKSTHLRRVEIDRLIEAGWPDKLIAAHVKCHAATIRRHRKAIQSSIS